MAFVMIFGVNATSDIVTFIGLVGGVRLLKIDRQAGCEDRPDVMGLAAKVDMKAFPSAARHP